MLNIYPLWKELEECNSHVAFCNLINTSPKTLNQALKNLKYNRFSVPKKNGGKRKIEHPNPKLHLVQKQLSLLFNSLYSNIIPPSSHGYIPKNIVPTRRDIISNALSHKQCNYLINLDLKDFFHSITSSMIKAHFRKWLPDINEEILTLLCKLVCKKNRLPMGSSSSPSLSNLISVPMDIKLQKYCDQNCINYTRYVDDLSFSSIQEITQNHINEIREIIHSQNFIINENKIKHFDESQKKIITGIVLLEDALDITDDYFQEILNNIENLQLLKKTYHHVKMLNSGHTKTITLRYKNLKLSVKGQVNYVDRILDDNNPKLLHINEKLNEVVNSNFYITQVMYV